MTFGERLRQAREKSGRKQKDVAAEMNITNSQLSRYENDKTAPSPQLIGRLAKFYNVSGEFLLGLTNQLTPRKGVSYVAEENKELVNKLVSLGDHDKKVIHNMINSMMEENQNKKKENE